MMDTIALQSLEHRYEEWIDAQTWAFIRVTESYYPQDTIDASIERQRQIYDTLCRAFHTGYPETVTARDAAIQAPGRNIPYRHYRVADGNPAALVVYFHGGGFVVGGLESHDDVCAELAAKTGLDVVSIDYRLSPEHVFPACFDDALEGFRFAASKWDCPVVVVGDSAGGNLAAAVCEATKRDSVKPIGQVLIYPALGERTDFGSYIEHQNAPMLTKKEVDYYHQIRTGGVPLTGNAHLAPLVAKDVSEIPPTVIFSAQIDPICDDGALYCRRLSEAGVRAKWHCETGLIHGYLRARHTVDRARLSFSRIVHATSLLATRSDALFD